MYSTIINSSADLANISYKSKYTKNTIVYIAVRNLHFKEINPLGCGFQHCPPGHTEGFNIFDIYHVHYVVSGRGKFYANDKVYDVKPGECFMAKAGLRHNYEADKEDPWYYIWVTFRGTIAKSLDSIENPVFPVDGSIFNDVKNSINYSNSREIYLIGCISRLISDITDGHTTNDIIASIKNHINVNYMTNPKITDIARSFGISRNHITRLFKEKTGISPQEYLINRKMKEAKKYLDLGMNVNETAQITGYSDYTTFSRAFKKYYGTSPSSNINKPEHSDKTGKDV